MEKSILRTVLFYSGMQMLFLFFFCLFRDIPPLSILLYAAAALLMHGFLYFFLIHFKHDFFNESTGRPLEKVNAANRITLLRISCLPSIAFLLHHKEIMEIKMLLPVLLALIFLTDSFDGQIARRKKQITKMGQMLDSISDYSLLAVISIVYFRNNIVPHWFFYLIFCRLFLQALGMLIFILMKKPVEMRSTWGGKITIAVTMTFYILELARLYLADDVSGLFNAGEYAAGTLILLLSFEKAFIFFRQGKKLKHEGKNT